MSSRRIFSPLLLALAVLPALGGAAAARDQERAAGDKAGSTAPRSEPAPQPSEQVELGRKLFRQRGCIACHSDDGTPRVGPTLLGLLGRRQTVRSAKGATRQVVIDRAYLRRALRQPQAERPANAGPAIMPPVKLADVEERAIIAAIVYLSHPQVVARAKRKAPPGGGSLTMLLIGVALFVGGHFLLSGAALRPRLVGKLGEKGYAGVYSLVAAAGLALLIWGYIRAPYLEVYIAPPWTRWVTNIAMPIAWLFIVLGTSSGPTAASVDKHKDADDDGVARGIQRVTRHPANFGIGLWALAHSVPNGDVAAWILFGSLALLAFGGMLHIDLRAARTKGEAWTRFASKTSRLPFVAIIAGRNRLALDEIGWVRPLVAVAVYAGFLVGHVYMFGSSPLPF